MGLMRNKNLEAEYSKALEDLGLDLELSVVLDEKQKSEDKSSQEEKKD